MVNEAERNETNANLLHVFVSDAENVGIVAMVVPVVSEMIKPVSHHVYWEESKMTDNELCWNSIRGWVLSYYIHSSGHYTSFFLKTRIHICIVVHIEEKL